MILSIPLNRLPDGRAADRQTCPPRRSSSTRRTTIRSATPRSTPSRPVRSRACGWPSSWAGRSSRHGTPSAPTRSRGRESPRGARAASPSPSRRTGKRTARWGWQLVEDTGFDAFDAGTLAESWRQQPGAPCYCTDLTREELPAALAAAERGAIAEAARPGGGGSHGTGRGRHDEPGRGIRRPPEPCAVHVSSGAILRETPRTRGIGAS